MNSTNGSPSFKVVRSDKFERTTKVLKKDYKGQRSQQAFVACVSGIITTLTRNPRPEGSRLEPIPHGVTIPEHWEFRKLVFLMPERSGASGQGRMMYAVDLNSSIISLLWIYTHEEFAGRPSDGDLRQLLRDVVDD